MASAETESPVDDVAADGRIRAGGYFGAFVVLGLQATLLGPAIPMLRERTGSTTGEISVLFVVSSLTYLAASVLGGRWYDRGAGNRLLAGALGLLAVGAAIVAGGGSLMLLGVGFAVLGAAAGVIDVGGNALLLWARPGDAGPAMNALHLCFALGALVGPLAVGLSELWLDDVAPAALFVALVAVIVAATLWGRPSPPPRPAGGSDAVEGGARAPHRFALALIAVFFLLYVGLELGFAGWVSTYAEDVGLDETPLPALVAGAFWVGFTAGRVAGIPIARRHPPARILLVSCTVAVLACGLLVVGDGSPATVWAGSALFGAAVAPQYPTMVALADERIGLSGGGTAVLVAASSVGALTLPWVFGQVLDDRGATALPTLVLVASVALLAWLGIVLRATRH